MSFKEKPELIVVNPETGEVLGDINEYLQMINKKKEESAKLWATIRKSTDLGHQAINFYCGNYWTIFDRRVLELGMPTQYLFRFTKLCASMNYDNVVLDNERKAAAERSLKDILGLSKSEIVKTKKYLLDNSLISIVDDKIIVNSRYCKKGGLKKQERTSTIHHIRIFEKAIHDIYDNTPASAHKKIGLLFELLPFINFNHNIICKNVNEDDIKEVEPYNITELTELLGYSSPQKLKKGLFDLKINNERVIIGVITDNETMVIVNPKIYYRGNNIDKLEGIINLFQLERSK